MYHKLLRALVVDAKIVDYQYFMDELQDWEIRLLTKMQPWSFRQSMEETRLKLFMTTHHKKKSLRAFLPLATDVEEPLERLEGDELNDTRNRIRSAFNMAK